MDAAASAGQPSDESAMRSIQAGNSDQLGVLFKRHSRRVFVQCLRIVGDPDTADDLVQETFLRVFRYSDSFRGTARFSTWLHRIASNVCIDHVRARERQVTTLQEDTAPDHDSAFQVTDSERVTVLRDALDKLPRDKRELLTMCRLEGLSYADMAKRLGVAEATLRVRVHRAMKDLKTTFDSLWAGEAGVHYDV